MTKTKTTMTKIAKAEKITSTAAAEILKKPYVRRLLPDEAGGYTASIHEFPGCFSEGETAEEALRNLDNAAESWVDAALRTGYEVRDPVSLYGHSGKIALRIPRGLHKQVAELAELEECSVNQLLTSAIAEYIGSRRTYTSLKEAVCSEVRRIVSDGLVSLYRNGPSSIVVSFPSTRTNSRLIDTYMDTIIVHKELKFDFAAHSQIGQVQPALEDAWLPS